MTDTGKKFYLYGKHICNCKWEFIGSFNKSDAEKYMDGNENTENNPLGMYHGFVLTTESIGDEILFAN